MNKLPKKYISVDVETSWQTPGKYSMLSLWACVVGDISKQIYIELKPISDNFIFDAMKIWSLWLDCIRKYINDPTLDPSKDNFDPKKVLDALSQYWEHPNVAMKKFEQWITENTIWFTPIEAAAPIKFDGMFTSYYFDNYNDGINPFWYSWEDINSLFRWVSKDISQSIKSIWFRLPNWLSHNALDDAIQQAHEMDFVLKMISQ